MAVGHRILFSDEECDGTQSCSPSSTPPAKPAPSPPAPGVVHKPAASSPPPVPSSPATPIQISNKNHFLTQVVVVVICVLAVCLLLLALCAFYRYWSSSRRRRRRAVALAAAWGPPQAPAGAEGEFLREDLLMAGEDPYHVWYIRTVGLDQTVIGAITVCEYHKGEGLVEDADCAVCLGEFGEGELLRLLPKCSHAFHTPCIDTWLRSHVNCPLCRAPVLAPPPARAPTPPPLPSPAIDGSSLVSEAAAAAAAQQSSRQATEGEDSYGTGDSLRRIEPVNGSEDGGYSAQVGFGVGRPAAGASFSSQESETWMSIDLGDGGLGDETVPDAAAPEEGDRDGELQPVRRSVSMDSWAMAGLLLRMRLAGSSRDGKRKPSVGEDASTNKKAGNEDNNCKGASLCHAPLEMARCMSGGRFSLSKFSGRGRGAILPL